MPRTRLKRLLAPAGEGGVQAARDRCPRHCGAASALDKATDEFRRMQESAGKRAPQHGRHPVAALANVRDVGCGTGAPAARCLQAVEIEPPKLLKGEDILSDGRAPASAHRELKSRPSHASRARRSHRAYAKQRMRAAGRGSGAARRARCASLLIEHDGEIDFATSGCSRRSYNAEPRALAFARGARCRRRCLHGFIK